MRVNRGVFNWGIFFVALGLVALAVRAEYVPQAAAGRIWTLWPLLLIIAGLGLLLRRTPLAFVTGVLAAGLLGAVVGGVVVAGTLPSIGCSPGRGITPFPAQQGALGQTASVSIDTNCGDVTVETAPGTTWTVSGATDGGRTPRIDAAAGNLEVDSPDRPGFGVLGAPDDLRVGLPQATVLELKVQVNAGTTRLRLMGGRLRSLETEVNAGGAEIDLARVSELGSVEIKLNAVGNARITLPNANLNGSLDANASTVGVCPPAGTGLRFTTDDNITASNNFSERGLARIGDAWETPGYASAATRIDLAVHVNAARIVLDPAGACGG